MRGHTLRQSQQDGGTLRRTQDWRACGQRSVLFRQHARDKFWRAEDALVRRPLITTANGLVLAQPATVKPATATRRLVAYSCKGRICPSCCGRRMAALATHLVDGVLGGLPVRQWVLTLPYRLRYALAWNHRLCRAVLAVFMRAVLTFERRRADRRTRDTVALHRPRSVSSAA